MSSNLIRNMLISAGLLGFFGALGTSMVLGIHQVTKEKIDANIKANLLKSLNTIIPAQSYNNDLLQSTIQIPVSSLLGNDNATTVYQAKRDNKPVAVAFDITAPDGYSGDINILIAIKANGDISGVRIISHKETPGLGDKIEATRSDWITKFSDKSLKDPDEKQWKVKKDGGVFDQFQHLSPSCMVGFYRVALPLA